jgi:hypothetical protein
MKPFVLSLSKHEWLQGLRQAQAERNAIPVHAVNIYLALNNSSGH